MIRMLSKSGWSKLPCTKYELRLDITLKCGQSFRWKQLTACDKISPPATAGAVYIGVLHQKLLLLSQDDENVYYQCVSNQKCNKTGEQLHDYFQLDVHLEELYQKWSKVDPVFKSLATDYIGVRILRQDPVENVFSFICSANNNISRENSIN